MNELFKAFKLFKEKNNSNNLNDLNYNIFEQYEDIKNIKFEKITNYEIINDNKIKIDNKEYDDDTNLPDFKELFKLDFESIQDKRKQKNIFYIFFNFISKLKELFRENSDIFQDLYKIHKENLEKILKKINEPTAPDNITGGDKFSDLEEKIKIKNFNNNNNIIDNFNFSLKNLVIDYKNFIKKIEEDNQELPDEFQIAIRIIIDKFQLDIKNKTSDEELYDKINVYLKRYNRKQREDYLKQLSKIDPLLNIEKGTWLTFINDETISGNIKNQIKIIQEYYDKIVYYLKNGISKEEFEKQTQITSSSEDFEIHITNEYIRRLELIEKKIKNNDKISEDDINFYKNYDVNLLIYYDEQKEKLKDDKEQINKLEKIYKKALDLYIKLHDSELTTNIEKKLEEGDFKKNNEIYWKDYIFLFKIVLTSFVYLCIVTIIFIFFLSILGLLTFIYDLIENLFILFINRNNGYGINANSLDYRFKDIIKCSRDNFSYDRFYILNGQRQNITIFNICSYIIYCLIFYIMLYVLILMYSKIIEKQLIGDISEIDPNYPFIILAIIFFAYSLIHLFIYKYIFRDLVFRPYKRLDNEEIEIDKIIDKHILILNQNSEDSNDILIDNDFFDLIFDASRIDELNKYFLMEINNKNLSKCLTQKIMIYNLYNYFHEYLIFDKNIQDLFIEYCTNDYTNKPPYDPKKPDGFKATFISLININETKLIRKYHEELEYNEQITDENLEFYNNINKIVDKAIGEINSKIISYNKTSLPFIITILYIILILVFNFGILYLILTLITIKKEESPFNQYIVLVSEYLMNYIFNPIVNYIKTFFK